MIKSSNKFKLVISIIFITVFIFNIVNVNAESNETLILKVKQPKIENNSKTINLNIQLNNTSNNNIDLSTVSIRYYFTSDTKAGLKFKCQSSKVNNENIIGKFINVKGVENADKYLEIKFNKDSGVLKSGKKINLTTHILRDDKQKFDLSNDYSVNKKAKKYIYNDNIPVIMNGTTVSGKIPKGTIVTDTVSSFLQDNIKIELDKYAESSYDWNLTTNSNIVEFVDKADDITTNKETYTFKSANQGASNILFELVNEKGYVMDNIIYSINISDYPTIDLNSIKFNYDIETLSDGIIIASDSSNNIVYKINTVTKKLLKSYQVNDKPNKIAYNPSSSIIATTQGTSNNLSIINTKTGSIDYFDVGHMVVDIDFISERKLAAIIKIGYSYEISIIDIDNKENFIHTGTEEYQNRLQVSNASFIICKKDDKTIYCGNSGISSSTLVKYQYDETLNKLIKIEKTYKGSNGQDLAISPDGKHLAFPNGGGNGEGYTIHDIKTSNISEIYGEWNTGSYPTSAMFSADSKYILATNRSNLVIYNVDDYTVYEELENNSNNDIKKVGLSKDFKYAYAITDNGKLQIYNIKVPELPSIDLNSSEFTNEIESLNNNLILVSDKKTNKIYKLNAITSKLLDSYQLNNTANKFSYNPTTEIIVANQILPDQTTANQLAVIDTKTGNIQYIDTEGSIVDIDFIDEKKLSVIININGKPELGIIDLSDGTLLVNTGTEVYQNRLQVSNASFIVCNKDDKTIYCGNSGISSSTLVKYQYNETSNKLVKIEEVSKGSNGQDLAISPDGKHLAFPNGAGNGVGYTIHDIKTSNIGEFFGEWNIGSYPTSAAFSADSKYILATNRTDLVIYNVEDHSVYKTVLTGSKDDINKVCLSKDFTTVYSINEYGKLVVTSIN
ncbi:MAG: cellulose binding domain-containing protein [Clostridiales bacterium]